MTARPKEKSFIFNTGADFMSLLVKRLDTLSSRPEEFICNQDEESNDMYFIIRG